MFKTIIVILLLAYLGLLFNLTLISNQWDLPFEGGLVYVVPFYTIARFIRRGGWPFVVNILGNLAAFVPLGFLLPLLRNRPTSYRWIALAGAGLSLTIEVLQLVSARRIFDVDDVILNTLGAVIGLALLRAARWAVRLSTSKAT